MAKTEIAVLVTTEKGVFFGYLPKPYADGKTVRITRARMAVYWSANVKGVLGLASTGPKEGCRIGPACPALTIHGVTAVAECSDEAIEKWEKATWNN